MRLLQEAADVFDDWRRFTSRFLIALFRVKTVNLIGLIYSTILVQAVTPLSKARSKINRRRYMVRMTLPKARKA